MVFQAVRGGVQHKSKPSAWQFGRYQGTTRVEVAAVQLRILLLRHHCVLHRAQLRLRARAQFASLAYWAEVQQ